MRAANVRQRKIPRSRPGPLPRRSGVEDHVLKGAAIRRFPSMPSSPGSATSKAGSSNCSFKRSMADVSDSTAQQKTRISAGFVDSTGRSRTTIWRPGSESNRRTRLCRPLHDHSATWPVTWTLADAASGERSLAARSGKNKKPRRAEVFAVARGLYGRLYSRLRGTCTASVVHRSSRKP